MPPAPGLQFLRPYTWKPAGPPNPAYLRFYHAFKYPRLSGPPPLRIPEFLEKYAGIEKGAVAEEEIVLHGRVGSQRRVGSKLLFLDMTAEFQRVQGMCNLAKLADGTTPDRLTWLAKELKRNDTISITGRATRTKSGELTIQATRLPELLTPCAVPLPETLIDEETRIQNRHVDMLVNCRTTDTLRLRSHLIRYMRDFFHGRDFLEVQTPILAGDANGATARPFTVSSNAVSHRDISLRIAPELWLKRLVIGGVDRVFELGPAFRNEGIDRTHNPEFTICEFYQAYSNLPGLISLTEDLIRGVAAHCQSLITTKLQSLPPIDLATFEQPFQQAEFIPTLEATLGFTFPDLTSPTALADLISLLKQHDKHNNLTLTQQQTISADQDPNSPPPPPPEPSLAQLLDELAEAHIEPLSAEAPLFITHHPVCMSPLAKSFTCPRTNQAVAARAELFIGGRELANMYEEENDPFEQRRKFVEQARAKRDAIAASSRLDPLTEEEQSNDEQGKVEESSQTREDDLEIDEDYVHALASGLPPTGGWGCGIERLVMLFAGTQRIADCLSFGTLKNVVGMSSAPGGSSGEGE
ncbi:uncharacterized protein C8A04DRAFT_36337 [Dichotomopilus funicola]|uniref:Lysyl-tRNA synthetase n=1 Tax=Dichotomopilus funicola TaxID=1934379 RepID=A0AAN6V4K3_9PEZI|nr:hypothetical protein C8A04DRAFT_36337 [Dichotomopilus funicola]